MARSQSRASSTTPLRRWHRGARGARRRDEPRRRAHRQRDVPERAPRAAVRRRQGGRRPARATAACVYFDVSVEPYGAFAERTLIEAGSGYPSRTGSIRRWPSASASPGSRPGCRSSGAARWSRARRCSCSERAAWSGQIAVQAAKLLGAGRVVAAARNEEGAGARARAGRGRDRAARHGDDLAPALREAAGGDGFDLVLDPLWGEPARGGGARAGGRSGGWCTSASRPAPRRRSPRARCAPSRSTSAATRTTPPARSARPRPTRAWRAMRRGRAAVAIERVGLDDVPEAWRRQGSSPHRKLVVIP